MAAWLQKRYGAIRRWVYWTAVRCTCSCRLVLRPDDGRIWRRYSRALYRLGRQGKGLVALERAFALDPTSHELGLDLVAAKPRGSSPDRLGFIALGTTGLCNASCIHCPTGKLSTAHVPRVPMPMPLFRRIVDEIADLRLPITGQFALGLFGDGLVDPHVVERALHLRDRFPSTPIAINTNGAAFNRQRHAGLRAADVLIGLHCESIVPESFEALMQPLRLERLIPKYEQILEDFAGQVHVSIPLSRRNLADAAETRAWFEARGAAVIIAAMASRCAEDRTVFDQLAFRPSPIRCSSAVLDDLVIDCDGMVLRCCQDFRRAEPIGSLTEQSLRELIFGRARQAHAEMLDRGGHAGSETCSRCFADNFDAVQTMVPASR